MVHVLAATLLILAAAPATPVFPSVPTSKQIEDGYAGLAAINAPYQSAIGDIAQVMKDAMDAAGQAIAMHNTGATPLEQAKLWAGTVTPRLEERVNTIRTRLEALPPVTEAAVRKAYPMAIDPALVLSIVAGPEDTRKIVATIGDFVVDMDTLDPLAASGDDKAYNDLRSRLIDGTQSLLVASNAISEKTAASINPQDPQHDLMLSELARSHVLIILLGVSAQGLRGETVKPQDVAAQISPFIANGRAATASMRTHIKTMTTSVQASLSAPENASLRDRMMRVLASYDESADLEARILDRLEAIERSLQNATRLEGIAGAVTDLQPLSEEASRLGQARQDLLAK